MSACVASTLSRLAAAACLGAALSGCMTDRMSTGSIAKTSVSRSVATDGAAGEARTRALAAKYAAAYEKNPSDLPTAYGYGVTLRALGQRAQAVAVLETAALRNPTSKQVLAAYGRALGDVGRYEEALTILQRAHTPEAPNWRLLNAQGAILDQLGRPDDARGNYEAALKIAPGDPSILSNLGLSYALSKDLAKAEATLARAAASPNADDTVRANLAMVQGLRAGAAAAPAKKARG